MPTERDRDRRNTQRKQLDGLYDILHGPGFGRHRDDDPHIDKLITEHLHAAFSLLCTRCLLNRLEEDKHG